MAMPLPRKAPYREMASTAYSEHVGMNLHEGGRSGEIANL